MPMFHDILMLGAYALSVGLITSRMLATRLPQLARTGLIVGSVLASLPLLNSLSFAEWLRGGLGELSITTLLILGLAGGRRLGMTQFSFSLKAYGLGVVLLGSLIYFDTLTGIGPDFYALGYDKNLAWIAITLAAGLYFLRQSLLGWWLIFVVLSWNLHLLYSNNFFDYLIDAPLWLALVFHYGRVYFRRIRSS